MGIGPLIKTYRLFLKYRKDQKLLIHMSIKRQDLIYLGYNLEGYNLEDFNIITAKRFSNFNFSPCTVIHICK